MQLTQEQLDIGKDNFNEAVGFSRRTFIQGAAASGAGLGAYYFGYKALTGDRVRVAFIGTGDEGSVLINEHPNKYMEVVAIADLRPENRKKAFVGDPRNPEARMGLVRKLGADDAAKVQTFDDHKALLAKKDELGLEAVIIAVPLSGHHPVAMDCLDAGLHVLSEKLMAHNITECKELIRKAKSNKDQELLYAVGHQRHYNVLYENATKLIDMGLLGDIRFIRAQWHRNNSFPGRDSWRKTVWQQRQYGLPEPNDKEKSELDKKAKEFGYNDMDQLVNWRLSNATGGGLMAELGSHQMDACSIFLGKVHPLAVQGYGGKNFYGVSDVGSKDKQNDDRDIDDHIYLTFEFPGPNYHPENNPEDICVVTYSSMNSNSSEPYGETVFGSRATLMVRTEKDALLYKENGGGSAGGFDQRLWVISSEEAGAPVLDAYETSGPSPAASDAKSGMGEKISRGYREEMEHFCYAIRTGNFKGPKEGGLRCNGTVAMADAIMALTANLAMKHKKRIVFKDAWFDPTSDAVPETDPDVVG
jgi:predicted dehydrogenase